ncbi:hypothetical protein AWM75_03160 [Aerococcus urinaehominis]|uniref:beta-glucosidase n=1 Tax=Aerococcus urinaehominis TaxID=128944 RepID=A0A0X8FKM5_9LACT|nr:glycoside hydrolase family 3 N-terminal domain-containing protein [Aerococcus urinaehominis]AMB99060.1 hypothetical protein AWM75_03160 [Aerococcus urinaehominis]SDM59401.1 beta-glucosidase [Aerococcus urinaehominis]
MKQVALGSRHKQIIEVDGLQFRDLNGDGQLNPYEDWRLSAEERAADLVSRMNSREKAGMFLINDKPMGISVEEGEPTSFNGIISEVDKDHEKPVKTHEYPTTTMIKDLQMRHIIVRENAKASQHAEWANALQEIAEDSRLGIPVVVLSNSKNENASPTFNGQTSGGNFTQYPGTLGIAATQDDQVVADFAEAGHEEFLAANIRKGYMYMVDTATDPRWFRTSGTFGENPEQISKIAKQLIKEYQGDQLDEDSIALTIKHFPGGGARENGFDPHYAEGKFNVYPTPGSLEKYHLPPFQAAIDENPSSIMPYYAIPSNDKSATPQAPFTGEFEEEIAFAYNKQFVTDLLRNQMGFKGYVNSDTGVLNSMAWGAENLSLPERAAKIMAAGTNIVSGTTDADTFQEAIENLADPAQVDKLVQGTLIELFQLALFENPYADVATADDNVNTLEKRTKAYQAHQKSVVLLKNENNVLPLTEDKVAGKKIYVDLLTKVYNEEELKAREKSGNFGNTDEIAAALPGQLQDKFPHIQVVTDYKAADIAILLLEPISGSYFEATDGYLDLAIHKETNVDMDKVRDVAAHVDQVIINVNFDLPFVLEGVEELADGLTASFNSFIEAIFDVHFGNYKPTGKLPITLPANQAAIAVDENGICASPNDVPGYDKEKYMDIPYAYEDKQGGKYTYGFGLTY